MKLIEFLSMLHSSFGLLDDSITNELDKFIQFLSERELDIRHLDLHDKDIYRYNSCFYFPNLDNFSLRFADRMNILKEDLTSICTEIFDIKLEISFCMEKFAAEHPVAYDHGMLTTKIIHIMEDGIKDVSKMPKHSNWEKPFPMQLYFCVGMWHGDFPDIELRTTLFNRDRGDKASSIVDFSGYQNIKNILEFNADVISNIYVEEESSVKLIEYLIEMNQKINELLKDDQKWIF